MFRCYEGRVFLYQAVNMFFFCCKVFNIFNMEVYEDWLTFGASLKWPLKELHS